MTEQTDYQGKRGLVLLRVSTEEQEKKYGFPAQLKSIREKVLAPFGIRITDEGKYILRDTYTGMEFREREVLAIILAMAKRGEFDLLIMDKLDRLGRKGLQREIYRAELRMHGIRIVTTDPNEHADDDSLMGEMIRLLHGFKAEEERNDIIRRTQGGKRERVEEDHKLLGTHEAKYGWKYADEDRASYLCNSDLITVNGSTLLDETNEARTEVTVVRLMFSLADNDWTVRGIAKYLTHQHIPTRRGAKWDAVMVERIVKNREHYLKSEKPILAFDYIPVHDETGTPWTEGSVARVICNMADSSVKPQKIAVYLNEKHVPTGRECHWHPATVSKMLTDEYYIGRAAVFIHQRIRERGSKVRDIIRPENERIYLPSGVVPPILVTETGEADILLFKRVQRRLEENQKFAARNNQQPQEEYGLMRGGLAKCAYCMGNLTTFYAGTYKNRRGYRCITAANGFNRCEGVTIEMSVLDDEVWDFVAQIIRDPTEVDRLIEQWKIEDAAADRREYLTGEIGKIKKKQATLRDRLEEDLDDEDLADVKRRLREHKAKREGYEAELATETDLHEEWKQMQANIAEFLRECAEMREKLDDPSFTPSYSFKRKACVFFGIRAIVWKADHRPRIDMGIFPPSIVSTSI